MRACCPYALTLVPVPEAATGCRLITPPSFVPVSHPDVDSVPFEFPRVAWATWGKNVVYQPLGANHTDIMD